MQFSLISKNKKALAYIVSLCLLIMFFFSAFHVRSLFAAGTTDNQQSTIDTCDPALTLCNPIKVSTFADFIATVLNIVFVVGVPIVAFFLIYSGFLFVIARGNEEALATAKRNFLFTVIGAALLLGAWVLANAIAGTVDALK